MRVLWNGAATKLANLVLDASTINWKGRSNAVVTFFVLMITKLIMSVAVMATPTDRNASYNGDRVI